jgi:hypothetical protein
MQAQAPHPFTQETMRGLSEGLKGCGEGQGPSGTSSTWDERLVHREELSCYRCEVRFVGT